MHFAPIRESCQKNNNTYPPKYSRNLHKVEHLHSGSGSTQRYAKFSPPHIHPPCARPDASSGISVMIVRYPHPLLFLVALFPLAGFFPSPLFLSLIPGARIAANVPQCTQAGEIFGGNRKTIGLRDLWPRDDPNYTGFHAVATLTSFPKRSLIRLSGGPADFPRLS